MKIVLNKMLKRELKKYVEIIIGFEYSDVAERSKSFLLLLQELTELLYCFLILA